MILQWHWTVRGQNCWTTCPHKKGATYFYAVTFTNTDGFSYFFVHNCTREWQSTWCKDFLPHIRFVATILCISLRHKVTHFTQYTLHVSVDQFNNIHQKVISSKFMFKMSTIHTNTCTRTTMPLHNRCRSDRAGPAASTSSVDVF